MLLTAAFGGFLVFGCGDGTGPDDTPSLECTDTSIEILAVGEHRILDPTQDDACVRLPGVGGPGAEYLYVPVATEGAQTDAGISAAYSLTGTSATVPPSALRSPLLAAFRPPLAAAEFHTMLRGRERALAESPSAALFDQGRIASRASIPPVLDEQRNFNVCATRECTTFTQVAATARAVKDRVAIFVDNAAPAGGYSTVDLDEVATLFDDFLYPIGTQAFGPESDIDLNAVVIVLLTHGVNALSPDCNSTGSVILGYFFGGDLLPPSSRNPGSNVAEIFYGLVPDPNNLDCDISLEFARSRLPVTFIHEFQHMISFNQHALEHPGSEAEHTWLNEGLSHFAEELAGRLVPDVRCPVSGSCRSDFLRGNLENAFEYLASPEDHFMIEPNNSSGELAERGANWLFVRWLVDHFASDSVLGTDLTRRLVATDRVGAANVSAQTGATLSAIVPEWQMANYLDDLPGFSQLSARLRYKTWNFRDPAQTFGFTYPLAPDITSGADYSHTGVLRAGSGRHVLVTQAGDAPPVDLRLTAPSGTEPVSSSAGPRIGLVRVR